MGTMAMANESTRVPKSEDRTPRVIRHAGRQSLRHLTNPPIGDLSDRQMNAGKLARLTVALGGWPTDQLAAF